MKKNTSIPKLTEEKANTEDVLVFTKTLQLGNAETDKMAQDFSQNPKKRAQNEPGLEDRPDPKKSKLDGNAAGKQWDALDKIAEILKIKVQEVPKAQIQDCVPQGEPSSSEKNNCRDNGDSSAKGGSISGDGQTSQQDSETGEKMEAEIDLT